MTAADHVGVIIVTDKQIWVMLTAIALRLCVLASIHHGFRTLCV